MSDNSNELKYKGRNNVGNRGIEMIRKHRKRYVKTIHGALSKDDVQAMRQSQSVLNELLAEFDQADGSVESRLSWLSEFAPFLRESSRAYDDRMAKRYQEVLDALVIIEDNLVAMERTLKQQLGDADNND